MRARSVICHTFTSPGTDMRAPFFAVVNAEQGTQPCLSRAARIKLSGCAQRQACAVIILDHFTAMSHARQGHGVLARLGPQLVVAVSGST